jgi:hypothetical protein
METAVAGGGSSRLLVPAPGNTFAAVRRVVITTANVGVVAGQAVKITEADERELRRRASQHTRPWEICWGSKTISIASVCVPWWR